MNLSEIFQYIFCHHKIIFLNKLLLKYLVGGTNRNRIEKQLDLKKVSKTSQNKFKWMFTVRIDGPNLIQKLIKFT